ncbi:MAG: M1 family aminopeptidase [Pirellulales bacterium]
MIQLRSPWLAFHRFPLLATGCLLAAITAAWLLGSQLAGAEECQICRRDHSASFGIDLEGSGLRYAPDRVVDVQHIRLDVTPDFARHSVSGTASLTFRPIARPLTQLTLDGINLHVEKVEADVPVKDFTVTRKDLTILFAEPIPADREVTLHVTYSAEPSRGLYFRTPDMGYAAGDTHVWTQGEAHEARYWFPCFDYPNERSSTEVICHVPQGMTVLSNGRKVSESTDAQTGLTTVHWLQEKPHVNYLICLVAGYLDKLESKHGDVPLGFFSQPSLSKYAENAFRDTPKIMAFFEQEIGVPFPWNKYDQVTILDFVAGGMENTTLTTLTEHTVHSTAEENIPSPWGLDAHEMAHQWFGDYVTCKDWSHLWLNEGFATYYALLYEGHKSGRDALLYGLYRDATGILANGNDRKPIVYRGYKNAMEQFDYRAYPKGSWVLHMLRSQLGEDLFRKGVKTYLERHALSNVVTDDLRQVFEELSGQPLDQFFDQWVYHGRHPDLRIEYAWHPEDQLARLVVHQTHEPNAEVLLFDLPAKFRFVMEDGSEVDHEVRISAARHEFFVPLQSQPKIVRFDPDYTLLAHVDFQVPQEMWLAQLDRTQDVIGRVLAVQGLARDKSRTAIERIGKALREDPFFGVRVEAARALAGIGNDESMTQLMQSRTQDDARVRLEVIEAIGGSYHPEVAKVLLEALAAEKNPRIQSAIVRRLAKFQTEETRQALIDALRSDSWQQMVARAAMDALRMQQDPANLAPILRVARSRSDELSTDYLASALEAAGQLGGLEHGDRQAAGEFILAHVRDPRRAVQTAALAALGELGDPVHRAVLQSFAGQHHESQLAETARRAVDRLSARTPAAPAEVLELRRSLDELKAQQQRLKEQFEQLEQKSRAKATEPTAGK